VIAAGLIDGINPCAFATIVFFISFLTFIGRHRRDILITGALFTFAVFITYFLLGLGAFSFLRSMELFNQVSKTVYFVVGILAVGFGILSLYDYFQFKRNKTQDIVLQLPPRIKKLIHAVIRASHKTYNLAIAALVTGFAVSVLESICTGQVYLPTILFVLKTRGMQGKAFAYLLLYNIMFIIPLVIVFALAFFGTASDRFGKFMHKHLGTMKILTALLFFGLGALLLLR